MGGASSSSELLEEDSSPANDVYPNGDLFKKAQMLSFTVPSFGKNDQKKLDPFVGLKTDFEKNSSGKGLCQCQRRKNPKDLSINTC